jgi:3-hydroxymyristoyl/3-hydroxydecanoyl-(acyl carrier protein) dehydratase
VNACPESWPGTAPSFPEDDPGAVTIAAPRDLAFAAPLVAVDEVTVVSGEDMLRLRATKRVTAGDPYMAAHFPSLTVFPGVFILEAVRQAVVLATGGADPSALEVLQVRSARFLAPMLAGDLMTMEAAVGLSGEGRYHVDATCWREDGVTAAKVRLELGPLDEPGA